MDSSDKFDAVIAAEPFLLTFEDFNAMYMTQPRNRVRGWKAHAILWVATIINIGASVLFLTIDDNLFGYAWLSYINAALGLGILFLSYIVRPLVLRRHYKVLDIGNHELHWMADEEKMISHRVGIQSTFTWKDLVAYSEDEDRFFFWINKVQAVILPKRALKTAENIDLIRELAQKAEVQQYGN